MIFFFKSIIRKKGFEKKNVTKIPRDMMKFIFKKKKNHPWGREGGKERNFIYIYIFFGVEFYLYFVL